MAGSFWENMPGILLHKRQVWAELMNPGSSLWSAAVLSNVFNRNIT
jgi:hypothetical protein